MKPSRHFLLALIGLLILAIGEGLAAAYGHAVTVLGPLWWLLLAALLLAAAGDALALGHRPSPTVVRQLPDRLALDHWQTIALRVEPGPCRAKWLQVFDHVPADLAFVGLPRRLALAQGFVSHYEYQLKPLRRGHFAFARCEIALPSPLGLWLSKRLLPLPGETRVYPNFLQLYGQHLNASNQWLDQIGSRVQPRRGFGYDFHQLREFREGDSLRQVDWKTSARKREPIAREYQDERDQQLVFLLDCGNRMRAQDGALSHFDHALNACLLLGFVALHQGDAVGFASFDQPRPRYLPPARGPQQLNVLQDNLYDLHSSLAPSDFTAAAQWLLAHQQKRALVILISNLRDEDDDQLLDACRHLGRYHQLLIASLREEALDQWRQQPVGNYQQALNYCGAVDYLQARQQLHRRLRAQGLPLLDARPQDLGPQLVNSYLQLTQAARR